MVEEKSRFELTPQERKQRAALVAPPTRAMEAYAPYAEAWKEFDKLKKGASGGRGAGGVVEWAVGTAAAFSGMLGIHGWDKLSHKIAVALLLLSVLLYATVRREQRERFRHWPCPRCHAEWPGTKTEKESRCRVCGLRLHQMAP